MIKIKRGDSVLTVTAGAYKSYYKHLGYEPVGVAKNSENFGGGNTHSPDDSQLSGDSTQPSEDEIDDEEEEEEGFTEDEDEEESEDEVELSEIPLSEMDLDQLCEYADQLGLDYEGITSKKKMRALIREHLG